MIRTDADSLDQQALEEFNAYKETLPKEPEGDVKKQYYVGCHTAMDWQYIDSMLHQEGTSEVHVPVCSCECVDKCKHTENIGIYYLTDTEANELENHPKVKFVNINQDAYQGTYKIHPRDLITASKFERYSNDERCYRDIQTSMPYTPDSNEINRSGYQLRRCMQHSDPWWGESGTYQTKDDVVLNSKIEQYGDGKDVDVIVTDTGAWYGHPDFNNSTGNGPQRYVGGNVLPGNGTCDVLSVVLDAPYYIDPDFFNADAANRLMTRWDGTIVPVESYARSWWSTESTSTRSAKFVSTDLGGTATIGSNEDFGTISVPSTYTRANNQGDNANRNYSPEYVWYNTDYHGTPCMSVCYGKSYGWAFNANKWHINNIGGYDLGIQNSFTMVKVFHQLKPNNPAYGTKDPTITSNSWGYRSTSHRSASTSTPYYYFFRQGTGTVSSSGSYTSTSNMPEFLRLVGYYGDSYNMKGEMKPNSLLTAGESMIDAGVIFVGAAGNGNQKQVKPGHADWDNFWSTNSTDSLTNTTHYEFGYACYNTTNRPGFPQQLGRHIDGQGNLIANKIINVGALDYAYQSTGHERMVSYSDRGEAIDCWTPADDALAAASGSTGIEGTYPETYSGLSITAYDNDFGGTSSACPVAAGIIATKLQYNRSWTWSDVKTWISNLTPANSSEFYYGTENTTANGSGWTGDIYTLDGGNGIVMYDAPTGNEPDIVPQTIQPSTTTPSEGQSITITVDLAATATGPLYYTIEAAPGSSIDASDFDSGSLSGSFSLT